MMETLATLSGITSVSYTHLIQRDLDNGTLSLGLGQGAVVQIALDIDTQRSEEQHV